jgi:hypothetical protein
MKILNRRSLLSIAVAIAAALCLQIDSARAGSLIEDCAPEKFNLEINCDQGIVDARHKIEMTVKDAKGNSKGPFTAYVEASGSTGGAALSLQTDMSSKGFSDVKILDDTNHKSETMQLPDGWSVEKVTVSKQGSDGKWSPSDGHLFVSDCAGNKISNQ